MSDDLRSYLNSPLTIHRTTSQNGEKDPSDDNDLKSSHPSDARPVQNSENSLKSSHPSDARPVQNSENSLKSSHPLDARPVQNSENSLKSSQPSPIRNFANSLKLESLNKEPTSAEKETDKKRLGRIRAGKRAPISSPSNKTEPIFTASTSPLRSMKFSNSTSSLPIYQSPTGLKSNADDLRPPFLGIRRLNLSQNSGSSNPSPESSPKIKDLLLGGNSAGMTTSDLLLGRNSAGMTTSDLALGRNSAGMMTSDLLLGASPERAKTAKLIPIRLMPNSPLRMNHEIFTYRQSIESTIKDCKQLETAIQQILIAPGKSMESKIKLLIHFEAYKMLLEKTGEIVQESFLTSIKGYVF